MVIDGDGAADTLASANAPELLERGSSNNAGLVDARSLIDIIGATVAGDLALLLGGRAGVVRAVRLDNVVFDQWIFSPAVNREVLWYDN